MTLSSFVVGLLLAGAAAPSDPAPHRTAVQAVPACPVENTQIRAMAHRFMSSPSFAESRQRLGLGALTPADLRLLTDATDAAACNVLRERVPLTPRKYPRVATYYRVGSHYLVIFTQVVPPGETYITWHPLIVLDSSFAFRDAFAM